MRVSIFTLSLLLTVEARGKKTPRDGPAADDAQLAVKTTSGTYTGLVNATAPNVNQWLGIPYGLPPLGTRRFMPPAKAPDYGIANAKAYKPVCLQDSGVNKSGVYWELVPEFQNSGEQSEDCLYLNIWAPRNPKPTPKLEAELEKKTDKLPVIIWVCGGGFQEGGGYAPYQVPDQWIQRTQTHIVVTFNYRLNIFGFPGSPAANKNAGLMDIRLVVEWLKDNIAGFGGDANRMVLWGQSAGANAVLAYTYAHPTDTIVSGVIASSSGVSTTYPTNSSSFHDVAQTAGCANLTDTEELACMQKLDALELQKKTVAISPDNRGSFLPLADGVSLFANMTERWEKGFVAKVPVITGFTYNEAAAFQPFDISSMEAPNATFSSTDGLSCGVAREAATRNEYGLTTYRYLYSGNFTNITPRYWLGGMHSSELPIVFGTHHLFRGNSTELEWQTSFAMQSFWVSFATNSSANPRNHLGQEWPKFTASNSQIVVFGNATLPSASHIAPVAIADAFRGPC